MCPSCVHIRRHFLRPIVRGRLCSFVICTIALILITILWVINWRKVPEETYAWIQTSNLSEYVSPNTITTLIDAPDICRGKDLVVIVVVSAPENYEQRQAIRDTWGGEAVLYKDTSLVFFLGRSLNPLTTAEVILESKEHGDIVVEDFTDNHSNQTLKTVYILKWVLHACAHVLFLMKTTDDIFLNYSLLREMLFLWTGERKVIAGHLCSESTIESGMSQQKLNAFRNFHPDKNFPLFLDGLGYVISRDLIESMYRKCLSTPLFPVEDIYITGLVAQKGLQVNLRDVPSFLTTKPYPPHSCLYQDVTTAHKVGPDLMRTIWQPMTDTDFHCDHWYVHFLRSIALWI